MPISFLIVPIIFFYGECHGLIYDDNHKVNPIKEGSSNDDIINQVYFDDYKGLPESFAFMIGTHDYWYF